MLYVYVCNPGVFFFSLFSKYRAGYRRKIFIANIWIIYYNYHMKIDSNNNYHDLWYIYDTYMIQYINIYTFEHRKKITIITIDAI